MHYYQNLQYLQPTFLNNHRNEFEDLRTINQYKLRCLHLQFFNIWYCTHKKKNIIYLPLAFLEKTSLHKAHWGGNPPSVGGVLRFITTTSRMPSGRKVGEDNRGSTGPGRLKEIENGPGGHSCWTFIWNTADESFGTPTPVITPSMWTLPSRWISHFTLPARVNIIQFVISIFSLF